MLTDLEKRIMASIQDDIPIVEKPYLELAKKLNISEETFTATLQSLIDRKVVRRYGATLRHQKSGFNANVMTAWQVDESRVEEVGRILAGFAEVSHCYRRNPTKEWPYNIYTMIHGVNKKMCIDLARKMSETIGVSEYNLCFSVKELKKTSMRYFTDML